MEKENKRWWKNEPWRLVQTNLREIDWRDMNAEVFVQELQKLKATVIMINVGGIIANYNTDLDFQPINPSLKGDSLERVIDLCKKAGMRVVARMDFSKVREQVLDKHPDWVYRNTNGGVMNYNGNFQTCVNGDYQRKYALQIIGEVLDRFPIDGLYCNMGGFQFKDYSGNYHGICHCDSCKKKFMEFAGEELPQSEFGDTPAHRLYRQFQTICVEESGEAFRCFVRSKNPDIALDGPDYRRMESSTMVNDLPRWKFSASSNTRCILGVNKKLVSSNSNVEFIDYCFRHVAVSPVMQRMRLWQDLMNLGGLDYYLIGRIDNHNDLSGLPEVTKVFNFSAKHEKLLAELKTNANILVLRSALWGKNEEERGIIQALSESHIAFDEVELSRLEKHDLDNYTGLILADKKQLSGEQAEWIDSFCEKGGIVFATGESGMYTEKGEKPEKLVLNCIGVEAAKSCTGLESTYLLADKNKNELPGFENCGIFAVGDSFVEVKTKPESRTMFKFIPPHRFGPPEMCAWDEVSDWPGIVVNNFGKGKAVYMPWRPGALYYKESYWNTGALLKAVFETLCGFEPMVKGLVPQVEVNAAKGEDKKVVFLLNHSGHIGSAFFEVVPIGDLKLQLRESKAVKSAKGLYSGETFTFSQSGDEVCVTLPKLGEFEAVVLELE